MLEKLLDKMKLINPWHFVWISIVSSEIITYFLSVLQSRLWWGGVTKRTLIIGAADSSVVPLIVATLVIFFVKRAAELKKINERLEETNRELRELDGLKTDFVATVSHELRTPLTAVKAFVIARQVVEHHAGISSKKRLHQRAEKNESFASLNRLGKTAEVI